MEYSLLITRIAQACSSDLVNGLRSGAASWRLIEDTVCD
jgi:hypothetical protein